ncbi:o-sialoglycoprotein endopeptidase [Anaeramoeba flamelloides]|uniref:non-specific serine/threonine protein kinase n=1 Tax=Anaeramoeba flamelloides TaxID=1746091 RepID=A0AAV7Z6B7_9EUKA|nr:o-sialoglycoprotein endopeptidase [Anaeramoeba flamelloides]
MELISQGAEAKIYRTTFLGKPVIVKQRFKKKYRHPQLDSRLITRRLVQEARSLVKARKCGVLTPILYQVDVFNHSLIMEDLGKSTVMLKHYLNNNQQKQAAPLLKEFGELISKMHNSDLIHGDLTTSNVMVKKVIRKKEEEKKEIEKEKEKEKEKENENEIETEKEREMEKEKLIMIDFGLSFSSTNSEEKAVDLYVLERAFLSTHPNSKQLFDIVLKSYSENSNNKQKIMTRLEKVRRRGRKRSMVG